MATEPNQAAIDAGAPTIMLAGKAWPVPFLAPRQNRIVVPALALWVNDDFAVLLATTESIDRLTTIVFTALTRAHPTLTRDEFDDMPIAPAEIRGAIPQIAYQTGLYVPITPGQPALGQALLGDAASGEAPAAD